MHPMLNTAVKAARRAGAIINRASLDIERLQVARKGPRNYVTDVDQAAEEAIVDVLRTAYPEHDFLCEEAGVLRAREGEGRPDAEYRWIIDPLDGTTNFIHSYPVYCVSIALLHRGQLNQAVVFDPNRNELFTATRGAGAFLNDRRIRVSGRTRFSEALLGEHIGRSARELDAGSPLAGMLGESASVRRAGSIVLDLAYVAAGRLDGFCGLDLKPWDMAAGALLVLESGGLIGDLEGEQGWMDSGNVLAATPKVFARMLGWLNR